MNAWQEILKAFELVKEHNQQRPILKKEYRLYYNDDGSIIGMWENGYPDGDNFVVINHPDEFYKHPTHLIKIVDKKLTIIDPRAPHRIKLKKSNTGQAVVSGNAALVIMVDEIYSDIEYYEQTNN